MRELRLPFAPAGHLEPAGVLLALTALNVPLHPANLHTVAEAMSLAAQVTVREERAGVIVFLVAVDQEIQKEVARLSLRVTWRAGQRVEVLDCSLCPYDDGTCVHAAAVMLAHSWRDEATRKILEVPAWRHALKALMPPSDKPTPKRAAGPTHEGWVRYTLVAETNLGSLQGPRRQRARRHPGAGHRQTQQTHGRGPGPGQVPQQAGGRRVQGGPVRGRPRDRPVLPGAAHAAIAGAPAVERHGRPHRPGAGRPGGPRALAPRAGGRPALRRRAGVRQPRARVAAHRGRGRPRREPAAALVPGHPRRVGRRPRLRAHARGALPAAAPRGQRRDPRPPARAAAPRAPGLGGRVPARDRGRGHAARGPEGPQAAAHARGGRARAAPSAARRDGGQRWT